MNLDLQVLVSVLSAALIVMILFRKVLWRLLRLAARCAVGLGALAIAAQFGLSLGVNLLNALVLGVLGVPGFALLWALSHVAG